LIHALVLADIEGAVGFWNFTEDVEVNKDLYTKETQVCIDALLANGVTKITVCDTHAEGGMILPKVATKDVELISSLRDMSFDDNKYDFAIMTGFHGMYGSPGIFPHTMRPDYFKHLYIKDTRVGEVELCCRWLGFYGIPVILVTGDREAVYEANLFNPYRMTCCVKSLHQSGVFEPQILYQKLEVSIKSAMLLNWKECISYDNDEVGIEFQNHRILDFLVSVGYSAKDERLFFKNCDDLMKNVYPMLYKIHDLNNKLRADYSFMKEVRRLASTLSKEEVKNSDIIALLNKDLSDLDELSRNEILRALTDMQPS